MSFFKSLRAPGTHMSYFNEIIANKYKWEKLEEIIRRLEGDLRINQGKSPQPDEDIIKKSYLLSLAKVYSNLGRCLVTKDDPFCKDLRLNSIMISTMPERIKEIEVLGKIYNEYMPLDGHLLKLFKKLGKAQNKKNIEEVIAFFTAAAGVEEMDRIRRQFAMPPRTLPEVSQGNAAGAAGAGKGGARRSTRGRSRRSRRSRRRRATRRSRSHTK